MTADRFNYGLALLASVVGLAAVVMAWFGARRVPAATRLRHPSTPAPVSFTVELDGTDAHWRVRASASLPAAVAVDIVTFRPSGTQEPWISEPIIDPVVLEPGESAALPSVLPEPRATYDVVVAWTVRLPDGGVLGSRTLTVPPPAVGDVPVTSSLGLGPKDSRGFAPLYAAAAALLVMAMLVSGWELTDGGPSGAGDLAIVGTSVPPTVVPAVVVTTAPPATTATTSPPTSPPTTTTPTATPTTTTTTTPTSTTTTTTTPTTTTSTTTTTTPTSTTTTPTSITTSTTTTTTSTTTAPPADGRRVVIRGRIEECRYGSDCVIAGFGLQGDFAVSGEYVCEFDDGSRFVFRYAGSGAEDACATSGANPSITIEVDGVRSLTITRESPAGG